MKDASKVLKAENAKISINDIEDMQDDMEELLEDAGEISEILGRSYATPDDVDEADLDAELACLGDELESIDMLGESTPSLSSTSTVAATSSLPVSAPSYAMPVQPSSSVQINNANLHAYTNSYN